ncbi:nrm family protein [Megaselia abdita]
MLLKGLFFGFFIIFNGFFTTCVFGLETDETISEREGNTVELTCPVDIDACGDLHSLNWFKGEQRIAVFLHDENSTNIISEYKDRVSITQSPYRLILKDLEISDEELYICDTTYFMPKDTCEITRGYRIDLKVLVPPSEIVILDEKGDRVENGTTLGPLQEGHILRTTCVVKNTRPQPQVAWYRGTKRLTTYSPSYDETNGLFTAKLELSLPLSRLDLANTLECRVESSALEVPVKSHMQIDLQVRPTVIELSGVEHHTVQGSACVFTCEVFGARPAANITWTNSTKPIDPENESDFAEITTTATEQADGTFITKSQLQFVASRFENDAVFRCDADNIVIRDNRERTIYQSQTLEVMYPPVVKVSPKEITVNTSDAVLLNCQYIANPASLTSVKWYKSGELVDVASNHRYEGGNPENVALAIKETENGDSGNYTCELENTIGKGVSETEIELDVLYVPVVEVRMEPEGPVKESDGTNVTLYCSIIDANPSTLLKVRWYANSTLLKELPDCNETNEDLCHIDPSKLLLESIGRSFFYNYSCEGYNAAGWGPRSEDKELVVNYEPGPATLKQYPAVAVKKKSVTLTCGVEDKGYPPTERFHWLRGGRGPMQNVIGKDWIIEPLGLDSRSNYSCFGYNEGGHGQAATIFLDVFAPPFFIKNLLPYTGVLYSSRNASLSCRIECVPRCQITWLKDNAQIDAKDNRYFVKEEYVASSPATGDFESVLSVLHFNMSAWPNNKFDVLADNANYSCVSTENSVGPGVRSSTYFSIQYPPENTTVSHDTVSVVEDRIPGRVVCSSKASPEPSFEWRYNNKTIVSGNALIINTPMSRNDSGRYTCVAYNKHGITHADTYIDVQYKPRCEIERREINDEDTLICTAFGNPEEAQFTWSIKTENDSMELDGRDERSQSFFVLEDGYEITRTYRCVANNTVGSGAYCEIEVAGQLAWWQRWDQTTLIILVASILAILLAVIIICCIIICICRRKRRQDKLHDKSSSLGDPLTEPGEYENLPFHGLQTAPNKFTTTPTNINNTNNVVRVTSRAKQLQQQLEQQLLSSNTTSSATNASSLSSYNNTINSHNRSSSQYTVNNNNANETTITPNHNHTMNSVNNCFPKSYTEYYQQQQLQHHQLQQQQHHQNSADYPYTVERTTHPNPNNPFLATNFKKFHTNANSMTCSMNRKNSKSEDKKFYSLKFSAKKNGGLLLKQSMGKCKRHHSFADGGELPPLSDTKAMKMHFYEPPVYENLTDSIQILECNVEPAAAAAPSATHQLHLKKKHGAQHHTHRHNRQRILEDSNIILEPEKLSIYRSDSGISNSSFECITTPVPAPRQGEQLMQLPQQQQHSSKPSTMKAHSNPVYMNISSGGSSTSSPSNHVHTTTSLESPNDPSIASATDPNSSCNSTCNKHYKCKANNSNSKEIIVHQQQLQQQLPPSAGVVASVTASGATAANTSSSNRKCKRRAPSSCSTLVSVELLQRGSNTNPFLASNNERRTTTSKPSKPLPSAKTPTTPKYKLVKKQQQAHQQVLIPQELFPSDDCKPVFSIVNDENDVDEADNDDLSNQSKSRKQAKSNGYTIRPMRLPLRKHHSFHFQPSQTVAGQQMIKSSKPKVIGPLIYKPYLNESSAFKPISPVYNSNDRIDDQFSGHNVPRICGTTLKRHMSNVETYDVNRYNSSSSSQFYAGRYDSEDDYVMNKNDEEIDSGNEDLERVVGNNNINSNRLIYADLALPQARAERSERLTNGMPSTKKTYSRYATLRHQN